MKTDRSPYEPQWQDLANNIYPTRLQLNTSDADRGDRRNLNIIDGTATQSANILQSGMMSGATSPARPWKRLTTPDPELSEFGPVKRYLDIVNKRMDAIFTSSNLYNELPMIHGDAGVFATAALLMEEDFDDVCRFMAFVPGTYYIGVNEKGQVDQFAHETRLRVRQIVGKFVWDEETKTFDWSKVSSTVKNLWDNHHYNSKVEVRHIIMPNPEFNPRKLLSKYKRYASCYFEAGSDKPEQYLRESGYDRFPILAPRWQVAGREAYGSWCPGMAAIGDIKQLQFGEKRAAEILDKVARPPMRGPTSMANSKASMIPGGMSYVEGQPDQFSPAYVPNFRMDYLEKKQDQVRARIRRYFFEDLFLMLANSDRSNITATEIRERHEEKLLALGPVTERLNTDLLSPLVDNTFEFMQRANLLPPPPPELQGKALKVEFISIMAQAQKSIGIGSIERLVGFVGGLAEQSQDPGVYRKLNKRALVDEYADSLGVSARLIHTDEEVDAMEAKAAEDQALAQSAMAVREGAAAMKDLGSTSVDEDTALGQMLQRAKAGQPVEGIA